MNFNDINARLTINHDYDAICKEAISSEGSLLKCNSIIDFIDFDDGHYPGLTDVKTRLAVYSHKHSTHFLSVFDDLLSLEWCDKAYQYSVEKGKPWGK